MYKKEITLKSDKPQQEFISKRTKVCTPLLPPRLLLSAIKLVDIPEIWATSRPWKGFEKDMG